MAESCRSCGAPLAEDQRYCLNCGRRRGEPRIDFRRYEARPAAAASPAGPDPAPDEKRGRDYTPLAAVGGIAVLGVMLLIGVLIGKDQGGGTSATPAPVVVQGGEAEAGEGATAATGTKKGGASAKSKGGKGKGGAVRGGSADTGNATVASDAELEALEKQSPQEYSENSAKLPDEIATGGAPPPEDDKAPGGGSAGSTIE